MTKSSNNKFEIEQSARCFIQRIGDPNRGSKRVNLLLKQWSGTISDEHWVNGALSTTALRKRPHGIRKPDGDLGYKQLKKYASQAASEFVSLLTLAEEPRYDQIFMSMCDKLQLKAEQVGLYWTFGRSQKFFNILTKYWFCMSRAFPSKLSYVDLELIKKFSVNFHAPVDSVTLRFLRQHKQSNSCELTGIYWGWNMTKLQYECIQKILRLNAAQNSLAPVAYELIQIW